MGTNTDNVSASAYPLRSGSKAGTGASLSAGLHVDADPNRRLKVYTQIAIRTVLDPPLVADQIASRIGEGILYVRPRCTELVQLNVIQYGVQKIASTCGRSAGTLHPTVSLAIFIAEQDPDDAVQLERSITSFIVARRLEVRLARHDASHGADQQIGRSSDAGTCGRPPPSPCRRQS
jgi:hypothetical protein